MMKKTLVALAATAVTGAFAQVAITGNIDLGILAVNGQTQASNTTGLAASNVSTSTLAFSGSEDLGGGLKAGFKLETTLTANTASSLDNTPATGFSGVSNVFSGTPFNSEQFISLSGNFGAVRFGVPNAALFRAQGVSQPFGTGTGSGYSGTFSRLGYTQQYAISDYLGTPNGSGNSLRVTRMQNTIQYETPVVNGLSAMAEYAMQNDNATSTTAFGANSPEFMGLLVNYSAGNLNVAAAYNTVKAGTNKLASGLVWTQATMGLATHTLGAGQNIAYSFLGGNYTMGAHTLYGGMTYVKESNASEDTTSWNLAYKYALDQNIDLLANIVSRTNNLVSTSNLNSKLLAAGADYRFSKRTSAYVRYEVVDTNTDNASTGETIRSAIGIRHQF